MTAPSSLVLRLLHLDFFLTCFSKKTKLEHYIVLQWIVYMGPSCSLLRMGLLTLMVFFPLGFIRRKLGWLTVKGNTYRNPEQAITLGTKIACVYAKSALTISAVQCGVFLWIHHVISGHMAANSSKSHPYSC